MVETNRRSREGTNFIIRRSEERGTSDLGWLDSRHTFSFGGYWNPAFMGFRSLRVINEDRVLPGKGFGTHPHENMEILSYVVEGAMEHRDSMGNGSVIVPGELQRMTAGTGVMHSEYNRSATETLHFLQIWILPEEKGLEPGYEQKAFPFSDRSGELLLVASRDGRQGSLTVHQDISLFAGKFREGEKARHELGAGRHGWIQVVRGRFVVNREILRPGDGASAGEGGVIEMAAQDDAEVLLFDLD